MGVPDENICPRLPERGWQYGCLERIKPDNCSRISLHGSAIQTGRARTVRVLDAVEACPAAYEIRGAGLKENILSERKQIRHRDRIEHNLNAAEEVLEKEYQIFFWIT